MVERGKNFYHETYDLIGNTQSAKGEVISEAAVNQVVDLSSKG